ncbi:MAG: GNAT family N-acetyltransferase [Gammaproteobacteria bacterium]|nr:GNAT family N-acetyltransferase [Gammaproteobacteria bacterium]MCZ6827321.1 GNAT family N-acetyltransferase [Gammaproteobacteria bacterium]
MLTIRAAEKKDFSRITALVETVLNEFGMELCPEGMDSDLSDIEENYVNSGGLFIVLQNEKGEIGGTAGLMRLNDRQCELRKMYFLPAVRGRGWGKSLLDFLIDSAAKLGFDEIHLESNDALHAAIGLYLKVGFEEKENVDSCDVRCDRAFYLALANYRRPTGLRELNVAL